MEGELITKKQNSEIFEWLVKNIQVYDGYKLCEFTEKHSRQKCRLLNNKININDNVYLQEHITEIKYPFGYVKGGFSCYNCEDLISLKGSPERVSWFNCCKCHSLISLEDISQIIDGYMACDNNFNLKSLIGMPRKLNGGFRCVKCDKITSFIGCPEIIEEDFEFNNSGGLLSFVGFPKNIIGGVKMYINRFDLNTSVSERYKIYLAMWLELLESVNNEERKEYITNYKDKTDFSKRPIIPIEILKEYGF